jgi:hypothetical protein
VTGTEDPMTAALRAVNVDARYAALLAREIDYDADSLHPDEFVVALRATGRDFAVPSWYSATLAGADDGRPYELWARFQVQSNAHEVEFGIAATTPHGRIGGILPDLAGEPRRPLPFRTRAHLDDAIALALDILDRLREVAAHAAPGPVEPHGDPILDALAGIDFGRRYFALCDVDAGEPEPTPDPARQRAVLLAAGFEPTYDRHEDFFACRLAGPGPASPGLEQGVGSEMVVNVVVRFAAVELTMALHTPAGWTGATFHVAAKDLMERSVPAWRHEPSYPLVPFGARRPFEAAIGEIAALVRDVHAALAGGGR